MSIDARDDAVMAHDPSVYRFFDGDGRLLYVGKTVSPRDRFKGHSTEKPWWPDVASITVEKFATEQAAIDAERAAIEVERPAYNVQHNAGQPAPFRRHSAPIAPSAFDHSHFAAEHPEVWQQVNDAAQALVATGFASRHADPLTWLRSFIVDRMVVSSASDDTCGCSRMHRADWRDDVSWPVTAETWDDSGTTWVKYQCWNCGRRYSVARSGDWWIPDDVVDGIRCEPVACGHEVSVGPQ